MSTSDLDYQLGAEETNSVKPSSNSDTSPSDNQNWEDRFKGLQKTFNRLQSTLKAKEDALAEITAQLRDAQAASASVVKDYETRVSNTELTAQQMQKQLEEAQKEAEQLRKTLQIKDRRDTIRKELFASEEFRDLSPWLESDLLRPFAEDGTPLEGEALTTYLASFKEQLSNQNKQNFEQTMRGANPAALETLQATSAGASKMSFQDLERWVNNPINFQRPEYDTYVDEYSDRVKDRK